MMIISLPVSHLVIKASGVQGQHRVKTALYGVGAWDGYHNSTNGGLPLPRGHGAKAVNQVVDERAHLRRDISLFWINGQNV